jgi:hypothetical protein
MKRVILFVLILGGIFFAQIALAQGIGISPVSFEITANPGDVIENQLKVYNPSTDTSIGIKMEVGDITPTGEMGYVIVEPAETETYSLARWVKCEPEEFDLAPKEERVVKFTIFVPENAEPGGHYGTVLAGTKAVSSPGGAAGAAIVQRAGAVVLLSVPGEMKEELVVKEFSAPSYSEYGPIKFTIKFENKGTVHLKPTGFVTVTNWLGKEVGVGGFPSRNILPGAVRKFETSLDKKWFFAGKYRATLSGSYGISNIPFSVVITFWAFPWKVGLMILVAIILLILIRKRLFAAFKVLIKGERR